VDQVQNSVIPAVSVLLVFALAAAFSIGYARRIRYIRVFVLTVPWVVFLVLVVVVRGWSFFVPDMLNPDEAQVLAEAVKITHGGFVPWADYDLLTVGPLEPITAAPLVALFPAQPYIAMRLSIVFGVALMALSATVIGWQLVRWGVAQSFAAIVLAVFLLPAPLDLFSYSTEVLPVTLLLSGACLVTYGFVGVQRVSQRTVTTSVLAGFFLLGLIPFAKLQVAPLVLCVLVAYWFVAGSVIVRRRVALALPLAAPIGAVSIVCLVSMRVRDAFFESTRFVLQYSSGEIFPKNPYSDVAIAFTSGVLGYLLVLELVMIVALSCIALKKKTSATRVQGGLVALMLMGPVGLAVIVYTGMGFPHHLFVALYTTVFGVAIGLCFLQRWAPTRSKKYLVIAASAALCAVFFARPVAMQEPFVMPAASAGLRPQDLRSGETPTLRHFLDSCPSQIALWGWDPGILVETGKSHVGPWSVLWSSKSDQSMEWLEILYRSKPICILDATGPTQFAFTSTSDTLVAQAGAPRFLKSYREVLNEPNYRGYRLIG